jgi:PAS domain S-box-containing protein
LPFGRLNWNAQVKEQFGLPADADVTIDTFFERLHPDDRQRTDEAIQRSIRDGSPFDMEYRTIGLDGRERWIRSIGQVAYDAGRPVRFDGITIDVTERVRQADELREADRKKDEFLATLAHELRNPLAPIRNSLNLLGLSGERDPAARQIHEIMERQVNHMIRLVDDLLEMSRITRNKVELQKEPVELAAILRTAVEISQPLIDASRHQLAIALPPEPLTLDADAVRLGQVFANLLNNAAKYTPSGGQIWLSARQEGSEVVVSVRDSGKGIEPEMLQRVFDLFTQVDRSPSRNQGGLGIGLTLVKSLVESHGGSVVAKSPGLNQGSEFIVRLPLAANQRTAAGKPAARAAAGALASRRLLVVDDNRDAANSLGRLLRVLGAEVQIAHSGAEALELLEKFRPVTVLLDIGMPGMDGYEVAQRVRERFDASEVLLIALTGWGQEEDRRRSQAAGFDHHLVKPVDHGVLLTLLAG